MGRHLPAPTILRQGPSESQPGITSERRRPAVRTCGLLRLLVARPARLDRGQPEVADLHRVVVVQEDVVRLEISVNDVARMEVPERTAVHRSRWVQDKYLPTDQPSTLDVSMVKDDLSLATSQKHVGTLQRKPRYVRPSSQHIAPISIR